MVIATVGRRGNRYGRALMTSVSGASGLVTVNDTLSRAANGAINLNSGGTISIGTGGATGSLTTGILNNGLLIFDRATDYTYGLEISGSGAVTKRGVGSLTLSGSSGYSGATIVQAGTLDLTGSLGLTAMTVQSGATLAGSGSSLGPVSVLSGALITPGANSVASLTLGGLSFGGSTATSFLQIQGSLAGQYDQILAQSGGSTPLTWGDAGLLLRMSTTPTYAEGTLFNLFDGFSQYTGNLSGITLNAAGTDFAGLAFTFNASDGVWETGRNASFLGLEFDPATGVLSVVPEPSSLVLCFAGLGVAEILRQRRKRTRKRTRGHSIRIGSRPDSRESSA